MLVVCDVSSMFVEADFVGAMWVLVMVVDTGGGRGRSVVCV